MILADLDFKGAQKALCKVLCRSKYFPTPAEIREAYADLYSSPQMDAMEAWDLVQQAIKDYGWPRENQALASLPAEVARMVEAFGWQELCSSTNQDTLRAQWRKAWETRQSQQREQSRLPQGLQSQQPASVRKPRNAEELAAREHAELVPLPKRTDKQQANGSKAIKDIKKMIGVV